MTGAAEQGHEQDAPVQVDPADAEATHLQLVSLRAQAYAAMLQTQAAANAALAVLQQLDALLVGSGAETTTTAPTTAAPGTLTAEDLARVSSVLGPARQRRYFMDPSTRAPDSPAGV